MRRTVLLALVALSATASGAMAADGFTYAAPSAFNWAGGYVGIGVGGGWLQVDRTDSTGVTNNYSGSGWLGGAFAGYNFQLTQNVLWGVEASLNANNTKGNDAGTGGATDTTKFSWDGTFNGRVGAPFGPALIYATGGLALAGVSETNSAAGLSGPTTLVGWDIGAGLDVALTDKLFGRIGMKHKSYGSAAYAGSSISSFKNKTTSQEVMIGLGMKLN